MAKPVEESPATIPNMPTACVHSCCKSCVSVNKPGPPLMMPGGPYWSKPSLWIVVFAMSGRPKHAVADHIIGPAHEFLSLRAHHRPHIRWATRDTRRISEIGRGA